MDPDRPPRFTIMTWIAIVFAVVMVFEVVDGINDAERALEDRKVAVGDNISYHYVARLANGTLWDTSRLEVAQDASAATGHQMRPLATYRPGTATIDPNEPGLPWGAAADRAVLGHDVGTTVTFHANATTTPVAWEPLLSGGEGVPREILTRPFQRHVFFQAAEVAAEEGNTFALDINLTQLEAELGPVDDGFLFNANGTFPPTWDILFVDVNRDNESLLVRHLIEDGTYLDVRGLPGGVHVLLRENETASVFRLDLEVNGTFEVQRGSDLNRLGFPPGRYLVNAQDEHFLDLYYNDGSSGGTRTPALDIELTILQKNAVAED